MNYDVELQFTRDILQNHRLHMYYLNHYTESSDFPSNFWLGTLFTREINTSAFIQRLNTYCQPNTIYQVDDGFFCHHLIFQLPDSDSSPTYVYIGPYLSDLVSRSNLDRIIEKFHIPASSMPQIEQFYYDLPIVSDEAYILSLLYTLGIRIWGSVDAFTTQKLSDLFPLDADLLLESPVAKAAAEFPQSIQSIEERYELERQLMQAVSAGQTPKAELILANISSWQFEQRTSNPLRNMKNYMIILNTLLRLSAWQGAVPPFHIDKISSVYAHKIEQLTNLNAAACLTKEMVRKYCLLVKNHSMKGYSLLIRKVLTQIDYDLTADLTLKALAAHLNINPSYLSTLFKKETGSTLTEYVNQKRIEHALFLLNSSNLQIQMIAQYSGIPDVNYFTKTFKKLVGTTPKEYRDRILIPFGR